MYISNSQCGADIARQEHPILGRTACDYSVMFVLSVTSWTVLGCDEQQLRFFGDEEISRKENSEG